MLTNWILTHYEKYDCKHKVLKKSNNEFAEAHFFTFILNEDLIREDRKKGKEEMGEKTEA